MIEAFMKMIDNLPAGDSLDCAYEDVIDVINYLFNSSFGIAPFTSFQLVKERHEETGIVKVIVESMPKNWPVDRLIGHSDMGELSLSKLFTKLYSNFSKEELRKNFLTYFALAEGRVQTESMDEKEVMLELEVLPVEIRSLEELKEELLTIESQLRLRRLRFAMMGWLSNEPPLLNLEVVKMQRELLLERTFMSVMYMKEERVAEAKRLILSNNLKLKYEVHSEINLLKSILQCEFFTKKIEAIKEEQALIADLLSLNTTLLERPKNKLKGKASAVYEGLDETQIVYLTDIMSCIKTFTTQIKNRTIYNTMDGDSVLLLMSLRDFNTTVYNLYKNIWRLQANHEELQNINKQNLIQEYQAKYYIEETNTLSLLNDGERIKNSWGHSADLEATQRCYEEVYEIEKKLKQHLYLQQRITPITNKLRKYVMKDIGEELHNKDLELEELNKKFLKYKESVRAKLKEEIMTSNIKIEQPYTNNITKGNKREKADELLRHVQERMQKLKVFYRLRLAIIKEKCKGELDLLRNTVNINSEYENKLSIAEGRDFILKQELVSTHENMVKLEEALKCLQGDLKVKNEKLICYSQEKLIRERRVTELESRLRQSGDKSYALRIFDELKEKEKEIEQLKEQVLDYKVKAKDVEKAFRDRLRVFNAKLKSEQVEKGAVYVKIKEKQQDLENLRSTKIEQEDESLWKDKYKELLQICATLKEENKSLSQALKSNNKIQYANKQVQRYDVNNSICIIRTNGRTLMTNKIKARSEASTPTMNISIRRDKDYKVQTTIPTKRPKTQTNFLTKRGRAYYRPKSKVSKFN